MDSLQQEEFDVLQSIFPDYIQHTPHSISLKIPVQFTQHRQVHLFNDDDDVVLSLSTLPHLILNLTLPQSYPLSDPPHILSIQATHAWLPHLSLFKTLLLDLWQPHNPQGVLYTWIEWIRNAEFLDPMQLLSAGTIRIPHPTPQSLAHLLSSYDLQTLDDTFAQTSFHCSLCLTYPKGSRCIRLQCQHVFCRNCLFDFWSWCIAEGDIDRVVCPDPDCVKQGTKASDDDLCTVVTGEDFKRLKRLRDQKMLEKDPTMIHCPMSFCQTPVPKPHFDDEASGWARLRTCHSCNYAFCAFCKRTWHGPITSCPISSTEALVLEYMALPPGDPARDVLERQFGKKNIVKLVQRYEEEQINKKWIQETTTPCPGCGVRVEKSLGCNHMTCSKCRQHFCYRCGEKISGSNPYKHFSTSGHSCFEKLFDFKIEDREWVRFDAAL